MIVSSSAFLHFFHSLLFRIFNPQPCHDHIVYLLFSSFLWFFPPLERLHWFILRFVYGKTPSMHFVSSFLYYPGYSLHTQEILPVSATEGTDKTLWRKETHNTKIVNYFKISFVNIYSKYIPTISSLSTSVFTLVCFSVGKNTFFSRDLDLFFLTFVAFRKPFLFFRVFSLVTKAIFWFLFSFFLTESVGSLTSNYKT